MSLGHALHAIDGALYMSVKIDSDSGESDIQQVYSRVRDDVGPLDPLVQGRQIQRVKRLGNRKERRCRAELVKHVSYSMW